MNRADRDLGSYVTPPVSEADLTRQWRRLATTLRQPAAPRRRWAGFGLGLGVAGVAGAIAVVLVVGRIKPHDVPATAPAIERPLVLEGSRIENQAQAPRELLLADGSRVALGASASLTLARSRDDELRLVLDHGSADFDVAHVPGRRFVVVAADVDVVVVGTRFVVTVSEGQQGKVAAVSVQRGAVEVRRPHAHSMRLHSIRAGQSWSSAAPVEPAAPPTTEPVAGDLPASPLPTSPRPSPRPSPPPAPAPRHVPSREKAAVAPDTKALFAMATQARLQGNHREAAAFLEKLCRNFPDDPRAPLAAFELGRIQLDTLREAAHAASSFHTARALARDPTLREVAAAREVEALDRGADASACRAARDAYRAAYPTGPHLGRVTAYCRSR